MNRRRLIIILVLIIILMPVGVTVSRYVVKNIKNYIMEANNFFFNSDKLVDGGTSYGINNWGGVEGIEIQFQLNNHKNNILTSDADIDYTLTTNCDTSVRCTLNSNSGTIYKNEKTDNLVLTITPLRTFNDNESFTASISASSSTPYVKTLSATFVVTVGKRGVSYEITDTAGSPYFIFRITNATDEPVTANLSFSPAVTVLDTTSDIMKTATYTTTLYSGVNYISDITFDVSQVDSVEIRFYKRDSSQNYTYPVTNNTSIVTFSTS